jgi:hypothetical protein
VLEIVAFGLPSFTELLSYYEILIGLNKRRQIYRISNSVSYPIVCCIVAFIVEGARNSAATLT